MKKKKTTHGEVVRSEVRRLRGQVPFQPFTLALTDGTVLTVRQPMSIAFDPGDKGRRGSMEFVLMSREATHIGSFEAVARVVAVENNGGKALNVKAEKRR